MGYKMAEQLPLPLHYGQPNLGKPNMTADDFLVGSCNEDAVAWLNVPLEEWRHNCLIIHGPEGCGKTHLLTAWSVAHGADVVTRMDEGIITGLTGKDTPPRAIAIDDADDIAGNPQREEWLQHLFNAAQSRNCRLLLTARNAPREWGLALPDIASRLNASFIVRMTEPDDDVLGGLMIKLFEEYQLTPAPEVPLYLLKRMQRSAAEARRLVDGLHHAINAGRRVNNALLDELMETQMRMKAV